MVVDENWDIERGGLIFEVEERIIDGVKILVGVVENINYLENSFIIIIVLGMNIEREGI